MQMLTIQIVTWNSAEQLRENLPALRRVDQRLAQIRVIDNDSQDESVGLMKVNLPWAHIIRLPRNKGFAGGHNEGFVRCTTPYVAVLNPDVNLNWAGLYEAMRAFDNDKVAGAQGKLYRRGRVLDSTGILMTAALNGRDRGAGEEDAGQYGSETAVDAVTGACSLYRLAALREVAGGGGEIFDEDFGSYKEDVDLGWRLRRAGWTVLYVPIATGSHRRSLKPESRWGWPVRWLGIRRRLKDSRSALSTRNWLWLLAKNATTHELISHSPAIAARLAVLLGLTLVWWPGMSIWVKTVAGLPRMIAKRGNSR